MEPNKNKNIYIGIGVLVVIIALALYFSLHKNVQAPEVPVDTTSAGKETLNPQVKENTPTYTKVTWEGLLPTIRAFMSLQFTGADLEKKHPISIVEKADVTGDGVMEAIVSLGNGGANSDMQTVLLLANGSVEAAQFVASDGTKSTQVFFPTTAGTDEGVVFHLDGARKLVYDASYSKNATGVYSCHADAYVWNAKTKTFDFNSAMGETIRVEYCKTAGK